MSLLDGLLVDNVQLLVELDPLLDVHDSVDPLLGVLEPPLLHVHTALVGGLIQILLQVGGEPRVHPRVDFVQLRGVRAQVAILQFHVPFTDEGLHTHNRMNLSAYPEDCRFVEVRRHGRVTS